MSDLHPVVLNILKARGYKTKKDINAFLRPSYDEHLHDPFLFRDMKKATQRIIQAIQKKEKIVIYGDYDIDGLTATTLLIDYFSQIGVDVSGYIPDRFEEGYGVNVEALKKLKKDGADLIITVDCGSKSFEALEWAHKNKLDVIVTDHHEVGKELPEAVAVVNHKRHDDKYPFKDLAGCGVAFKLVQALQVLIPATKRLPSGKEKWLLDLVAMGTVCDVVSLQGENRVLVKYGLMVLRKTPRIGIRALAAVSKVMIAEIDTYHLGYVLGPRLNAAGRMKHAQEALELLNTKKKEHALVIAMSLDKLNTLRRTEQNKIFDAATEQAGKYLGDPVLVLAAKEWSHGIVGIVASKIVEKFNKPTLLLEIMGSDAKGSARSCGNYNMVEALDSAQELLLKYGGHFYAAGCTLKTKDISRLRRKLNDFYTRKMLRTDSATPKISADVNIDELEQLNEELLDQISQLAPFGMQNPIPKFALQNINAADIRLVGENGKHLKLKITNEKGTSIDGIGFGLGNEHKGLESKQKLQVVAELSMNSFNGSTSLQLILREIVVAS